MTTTQKIIFTPAAPQDTTASARTWADERAESYLPAKPADAHAAGAHTPTDWYLAPGSLKNEHFLIVAGHSVAKVRTSNKRVLELIAAAPETAAERDRLRLEIDEAQRTYTYDTAQLKHDRDQAREQVKTLRTACEYVVRFSYTDYAAQYGEHTALQEFVAIKRHVRRALASVESEGQ
jgi:hypothetical protein